MKKVCFVFLVVMIFLTVQAQEKDNTLTPEELLNGWELLFDGETLKGWKAFNGDAPQTWTVDENSIYCDGTKGGDDILTIGQFEDFDLKFTWRIEENGNSGVIYRVREGKQWSQPYITGPEYQVHDEPVPNFSKTSVGSFYDVYSPSREKSVNATMEWNTGRIRISDDLVTHWVNGAIVMQCQMHSENWNKKVSESKWKNNPFFGKSPFGHIDFQNHGFKVWYKNIKIKRL